MIKIILSGASGRMSQMIAGLIAQQKGMKVVGAIEKKGHLKIGKKLSDIVGINSPSLNCKITDSLKKVIEEADVIVEYTSPKSTLEHLQEALRYKKAMVIGTTGLSKIETDKIKKASNKIPIFFSPNSSISVNLIFDVLDKIAKVLGDEYNVEIVETHHVHKKDAPSGTAQKMAEIIASARKKQPSKVISYGRKGRTQSRPAEQICIHALRAGNIKGRHEIKFISEEDEIVITHDAFSRSIFAKGAVKAIKFIAERKKGLFTTKDLI
jgi:4-hydroxy-tetrahydrodipicolinate reductase